ncbi:hypothetical protein EDD22DRAFT_968822 [Suillus occidentalis]|nr:hypothetical protein EDD22DRAFT_968822 [Suillus occidentalis]
MNIDILALDRQEVVDDLVHRLDSLSLFLDGINDLMKFSHLDDHELQRYSQKIIDLTECARMTLSAYKSAYFKLLICIRRRRPAFSADIGKRIASLLSVLESNFVIRAEEYTSRLRNLHSDCSACLVGSERSGVIHSVEHYVSTSDLGEMGTRFKLFVKPEPAKSSYPPCYPRPRRPFVRTKRYIPDEKQSVPEELSDDSWTNSLPGYSSIFEDMDPFPIPDNPPSLVATQLVFEV